jgi:uncharacterized protein YbcV (DUF1398 family)
LYKFANNIFNCLDAIKFKHTQFDAVIVKDGTFYATAHTEKHGGCLIVGSLVRTGGGGLMFGKALKEFAAAGGFPHGIDIHGETLAYTSYSNSSVILVDRKKLNAHVSKS